MPTTMHQAYCQACTKYQKEIIRLRVLVQELSRMADTLIDENYALVKHIEKE